MASERLLRNAGLCRGVFDALRRLTETPYKGRFAELSERYEMPKVRLRRIVVADPSTSLRMTRVEWRTYLNDRSASCPISQHALTSRGCCEMQGSVVASSTH